jgi:hypothetical protein
MMTQRTGRQATNISNEPDWQTIGIRRHVTSEVKMAPDALPNGYTYCANQARVSSQAESAAASEYRWPVSLWKACCDSG